MFIRLATGLVVMEGDSRTRGRGFESEHRIMDGGFLRYIFLRHVAFIEKTEKRS